MGRDKWPAAARSAALQALRAGLLALLVLLLGPAPGLAQPKPSPVIVLDVDGAIGPATTEYLRQGLARAQEERAPLVVIRMNTPGGLDSSTRDIIRSILASPVPVATYVAPSGARAASAGTYIVYASHLAAMAPGTHLGAATPVQIGGSGGPFGTPDSDKEPAAKAPADAMTAKAVNDSAAYIMSLAALHGRNAEWAEKAVREAATLTGEAALKEHVIELIARDLPGLLAQAEGRIVQIAGEPRTLRTAARPVVVVAPNWRSRVLGVITDPNIAYLLLLAGIYGMLFEFMSPGLVAPGVIGALCLIVGLFALNLLPVNYAGLALLVLGVGLLTAEHFTPAFGSLGLGGVVALALGSLLLFNQAPPQFQLSPVVVLVAVGATLAYFTLILGVGLRSRRAQVTTGGTALLGAQARIVSWSNGEGIAQLHGEHWRARAATALTPGGLARVVGRDGLTLVLEPEEPPPP